MAFCVRVCLRMQMTWSQLFPVSQRAKEADAVLSGSLSVCAHRGQAHGHEHLCRVGGGNGSVCVCFVH